jgi:hypothetical protein
MRSAVFAGEDPVAIPPERCAIGASRLADVTPIPHQTVRRKLELPQWTHDPRTKVDALAVLG